MDEIELIDIMRSPIESLTEAEGDPASACVKLQEIAFKGKFILNGLDSIAELNSALGTTLPTNVNSLVEKDGLTIVCLSEKKWLWTIESQNSEALAQKLEQSLKALHSHAVDVSDHFTIIRVSGEHARDTLTKGCPADLHPSVFSIGSVTQQEIVKIDILLHYVADNAGGFPIYHILVQSSHAEHLWRWLYDSGQEYGLAITSTE